MSPKTVRKNVFQANSMLVENGLSFLALGNASGIDRERGLVTIKPSGVAYQDLRPEDLVVVDLDGRVVEGTLEPSSDTATHLELYKAWPEIGGVVHTHSVFATSFAQAGSPIPCLGATHADFCPGDVPLIQGPVWSDTETGYEAEAGRTIVDHYRRAELSPGEFPGALVAHHGPFAWGRNAVEAADNALILENLAKMAVTSKLINPALTPAPDHVARRHFLRRRGRRMHHGEKEKAAQ